MRAAIAFPLLLFVCAVACTDSAPVPAALSKEADGSSEVAGPSTAAEPAQPREPYSEVPSLSDHVTAILESATEVELFTIDPRESRREQESSSKPFSWAIADRKPVDRDAFEPVLRILYRALNETDGAMARCFFPRHGITARSPSGPEVKLLICFECQIAQVWTDRGQQLTSISIERDREPEFSALFAQLGLQPAKE